MSAAQRERRLGADPASEAPGVTVYELDSGAPGPTVLILGGVHGNEIGGIVAAASFVESGPTPMRGRLLVAPIAHEAAWRADMRESPIDGLNLARVFPGSAQGLPTEVVAHLLSGLIAEADVLIDLHTSSPDTDMPLFAGCLDDGSEASTRAVELAVAFGAPTIWTHDRLGPGRSLGVARDQGIPAVYVESPSGGVLSDDHVTAYREGVLRILARLGLVESAPGARPGLWIHGDGDVDAFAHARHTGYFVAERSLLDTVERGEPIGRVVDERGRLLETVRATVTGRIATIRRHSRVLEGVPLVGVVAERPADLGRASDAIAAQVMDERGRSDG